MASQSDVRSRVGNVGTADGRSLLTAGRPRQRHVHETLCDRTRFTQDEKCADGGISSATQFAFKASHCRRRRVYVGIVTVYAHSWPLLSRTGRIDAKATPARPPMRVRVVPCIQTTRVGAGYVRYASRALFLGVHRWPQKAFGRECPRRTADEAIASMAGPTVAADVVTVDRAFCRCGRAGWRALA